MTVITTGEFDRDVCAALQTAAGGPLVITDHGRPAFVLMSIADYRRSLGRSGSQLLQEIAMPEDAFVGDDAFELVQVRLDVPDL